MEAVQGRIGTNLDRDQIRVEEKLTRFKYGFTMGAVGGLLFAIPSYIKTKQILVLIISPISMGLFFGTLVSVSSIIGKLEEPSPERDVSELRAAFKDSTGAVRYSPSPFWLHAITNNN